MGRKILLVSRCAWTLYNFRAGHIRALVQKGEKVIGGGAGGDGFEEKVQGLGIPFRVLPVDPKGTRLRADLILFRELWRWYRRERPDIVHHFTIKPVIYGSIAARLAKVPLIVNTVTGLGHVFIEEGKGLRKAVEVLYRLALSCAHFTFFQNPEDLKLFQDRRLVRPEKAGLLPGSGVDLDHFSPKHFPVKKAEDDGVVFLFLGRLLREKGVYEFVEAARRVKRDFSETRFQLLGRRDERNPSVIPLRELEAWQAEGIVTWLGEAEDVRPFLARADVVVLPSYREGLSRSLLEAAAMEKPLIATDVPGCREVIGHDLNGLRVPVQDPQALAQAMKSMMENRRRWEVMGKKGRELVAGKYDERKVIQAILERYDLGSNNSKIKGGDAGWVCI
jgi:glycosyltransferase involved in cell wall biosynthesis